MFEMIKSLFIEDSGRMDIIEQLFVKGRDPGEEIMSPVFMVNRQYLAMKYSQNMPVTASAYIATVTLDGSIAYYRSANSKNRDGQTSQILVVGKAFTLLPRKQQLALITYELIKSGWSNVAVNTEEGYESNISADVDARHTAIATYVHLLH